MQGDYTAIVSRDLNGAYVAKCAEVPGVEAEAESEEDAVAELINLIAISFEVNRDEAFREAAPGARCHSMTVDYTPSDMELSDPEMSESLMA